MFYPFADGRLMPIEPPLMAHVEAPLICRSLRYGMALKLEDLYNDYICNIDMVCHRVKGDEENFGTPNIHERDIDDEVVEESKYETYSETFHKDIVKKSEKLKKEAMVIKEVAKREQETLVEYFEQEKLLNKETLMTKHGDF